MKVTTSFNPCGHHVLIRPLPLQEKTEGGIILTGESTSFGKLQLSGRTIGHIVAIGDHAWRINAIQSGLDFEPWAEVGDKVIYSRHSGVTIDDLVTNEEYSIIRDHDIICVINDTANEVEIKATENEVVKRR